MFPVICYKTEAVAADDAAGLQDVPVPDDAVFPHCNIRVYDTVLSHFHMASDIGMRINNSPVPYLGPRFYYRKRLDRNVGANFDIICHVGQCTDNAFHLFLRPEQFQQFRKGLLRVAYPDYGTVRQFPVPWGQYHRAGTAFMTEFNIGRYSK